MLLFIMNTNKKNMETVGSRIRQLINKMDVTPYEISKKTGVSQSTLSRVLNDSTSKLSIKNIELLAKYFKVSERWLSSGENFKHQESTFISEVSERPTNDYMMVEYADLRASAGKIGGGDIEQLPESHRRLVPKEFDNGRFLVVRVDGDSMDDGTKRSLSDGDEVLIKEKSEEKWYDLPIKKTLFVITSREGNVLKQIKEINREEGYILCHSFNPSYDDFKIQIDDICQIFIVCKVINRQISLT